ncbi:hypothetical protein BT96DRAFT_459303 [Gymnopus androsaceus JB14]|uniref:Uncharacterized protein n=1 Tax=Gymnopus androsaceus JB14 TaxID=1447944 RepID=A0A6A4IGZ5_9AGAR|nr:hypothetical protein BT96DRAFT_459303 [Gymnopus androsaceus JB14]
MFLTSPPDAMNLDDDDDEEDFVASIAEAESSLRRRDLILDSYTQSGPGSSNSSASTVAGSTFVVPTFAERSASPAPMASDETSLPPSFSSSSRPSWSYITPNSGLTRASSIRRPTRSRTVDFNDFTSRRRSTIRSTGADENSSERDRDRGASIPPSASTSRAHSDIHLWSELDAPDTGIPDGNGLPTPASSFNPSGRFRHFRLSNYPSYHSSLYHSDDTATAEEGENEPTSDERNVQGDGEGVADGASSGRARAPTPSIIPLPRLRRGGLRAPESLLSRDASSLIVVADGGQEAAADTSRRAPSPPEMSFSDYLVRDLASGPNLAEGGRAGSEGGNEIRGADFGLFEVSEPTPSRSVPYGAFGYPTPGSSIDNEGV